MSSCNVDAGPRSSSGVYDGCHCVHIGSDSRISCGDAPLLVDGQETG